LISPERNYPRRNRCRCLHRANAHERTLLPRIHHLEAEPRESCAEGFNIVQVARRLPDVQLPVEAEAAVSFTQIVREVRAHQRQAEDGDIELTVVQGDGRDVARDDAGVRRDVVEAPNVMLCAHAYRDDRFAAAEVSNDLWIPLLEPTDVKRNRRLDGGRGSVESCGGPSAAQAPRTVVTGGDRAPECANACKPWRRSEGRCSRPEPPWLTGRSALHLTTWRPRRPVAP